MSYWHLHYERNYNCRFILLVFFFSKKKKTDGDNIFKLNFEKEIATA